MELKELAQKLKDELENSEFIKSDIFERCNIAIVLCRNLLLDFKKEVTKYRFSNKTMEIEFFKDIKQVPLSNLVYYFELKYFEIRFPKGNNVAIQKKYIRNMVNKLNKFFIDNLDFAQYIEQGQTYLDDFYFTRAYLNEFNVANSKCYYRDPDFCSSHDLLLAEFKANKKLIDYLESRVKNLGKNNLTSNGKLNNSLKWSGSKADITELVYGLYSHKVINNGQAELKEIAIAMEQAFNFEVGDIYKTFSEIRIRKKSRTKFLNDLSMSLIDKMSQRDS